MKTHLLPTFEGFINEKSISKANEETKIDLVKAVGGWDQFTKKWDNTIGKETGKVDHVSFLSLVSGYSERELAKDPGWYYDVMKDIFKEDYMFDFTDEQTQALIDRLNGKDKSKFKDFFKLFEAVNEKGGMDPDQKDNDRIDNIVKKAGGDANSEKALNLSVQMASAIQDGEKAHRRGAAAKEMKYSKIANIFFSRAKELGISEAKKSKKVYEREDSYKYGDITVDGKKIPVHIHSFMDEGDWYIQFSLTIFAEDTPEEYEIENSIQLFTYAVDIKDIIKEHDKKLKDLIRKKYTWDDLKKLSEE